LSTSGRSQAVILVALLAAVLQMSVGIAAAAEPTYLEDEGKGDFNLVGQLRTSSLDALDARIIFNQQADGGDHYAIALKDGKAKFYRVAGGNTERIGSVGTLRPAAEGAETIPLTVQRRDWRMALLWGDEMIAHAYDSSLHDGKVGTLAMGGGAFEDLRIQPVGDIFLTDDFVREEGGPSAWDVVTGTWEQRTLRDDDQASRQEADKSANAFSYLGKRSAEEPAITATGYWFWDVYSLEAAIQPLDEEAVGLVVYYQDAGNYIAIRWVGKGHREGGRLQVITVRNGAAKIEAEAKGGFQPDQWYCLRCAVSEGVIHVWVDDELRLATQVNTFGQGQIGLYTESKKGAFFDDVVCGPWELFVEDFSEDVPGKWQMLAGDWQQADGVLRTTSGRPALAVTGRRTWEHYQYSANIQPANGGACGLVVGYQDPKNYCLLRWAQRGTALDGKVQAVQVKDGEEKVLAEAPITVPAKTWYRAEASLRDGLIALSIEGRRQVQAFSPGNTAGAVGVFASGSAKTEFDSALVQIIPSKQTSRIQQEFADTSKHPEMSEWASTQAPWVKPESDKATWWTKGDYFGENALVFTIPDIGTKSGELNLIIGAQGPDDASTNKLVVALSSGSKEIGLTLRAGDKVRAEAKAQVEGSEAKISFERRGRWLVVLVNDTLALQADMAVKE